jgi:hypothetical protein
MESLLVLVDGKIMAKEPTYPMIYDNMYKLKMSLLKRLLYLRPDRLTENRIWIHKDLIVFIKVNMIHQMPYIELSYTYKGKYIEYKLNLTSVYSNLNKHKIWYFVCPITNLRCRCLYFKQGYFLHRKAFKGCMYAKQTQSKSTRDYEYLIKAFLIGDETDEKLYKRYARSTYAGKPTKNYLRMMAKVEKYEKKLFSGLT